MSSPNPKAAEVNLENALGLAYEVDIFVNTHDVSRETSAYLTAQELFNRVIGLCSDPFSDDKTVEVGSSSAKKLHPWVIRPGSVTSRNLEQFEERKAEYEAQLKPTSGSAEEDNTPLNDIAQIYN